MADAQLVALRELPPAQSSKLIDFEEAEIVTLESFPPQYVLVVKGTAPVFNMRVDLVPLIYIRQPEYWGIEVVGTVPCGVVLPAERPYSVALALAGVTGTQGVEVIGASRSQQLDVPPRECALGDFTLSIVAKDGEVVASATLTCSPHGGTHPRAAEACPQLADASGFVEEIPEEPGVCTKEFRPVVLEASGTWDGEPRKFSREFSNRCVGVRATGGVLFDIGEPLPG
jgi:Subtilisin inhibitor-like